MSTTAHTPGAAWEPLTPRGVAAFARASLGRLLVVQLLVAVLAGGVVVWVVHGDLFPVVRLAIQQLPPDGEIRGGQFAWHGDTPVQLAGNHWLSLRVDLTHSGKLGREAQLEVEFGREDFRVLLPLGYYIVHDYPSQSRLPFNQTELGPWWGAWQQALLAGAGILVILGLLASWTILATLYCVPGWMIAFLEDRDLKLLQSWRLAGAALMPGALFLTCGIFAYGLGLVDLPELAVLWILHFMVGWAYLAISPLFLPKREVKAGNTNPFAGATPGPAAKSEDGKAGA